jgi:hypothetical protein
MFYFLNLINISVGFNFIFNYLVICMKRVGGAHGLEGGTQWAPDDFDVLNISQLRTTTFDSWELWLGANDSQGSISLNCVRVTSEINCTIMGWVWNSFWSSSIAPKLRFSVYFPKVVSYRIRLLMRKN